MKEAIKIIKEMLEKRIGKRMAREIICILLLAFGVRRKAIMEKMGASHTTLCKYSKMMEEERVGALFEPKVYCQVSLLEKHTAKIEEEFAKNPPKTRAEAAEAIKRLTGVERSVWSVGKYLKKKV